MASGKTHDRFNILIGVAIASFLAANKEHPLIITSFAIGWLIATFIFSPDSDLMPKKRTGWLQFILYPYAILFKHRGLSHSLLFGTLTRVFYLLAITTLFIFMFYKMGYIKFDSGDFLQSIIIYFKKYDYRIYHYRLLTWLYLGMFLADASHILLDKITSFFKKLSPF